MKQALHIFAKDVRYLRYEILITLLAAAAFSFTGIRHILPAANTPSNQGTARGALTAFLPLTWWFLIARVIHAEALPGERQFWLTRPYDWKSLMGAKALFILVFVNVPLLLADMVIIHTLGFSLSQHIAGLLWTQVLLLAAFVLPTMAFSVITSGFAPLIVTVVLLFSGILALLIAGPLLHGYSEWMELEWVKTYSALAVAAAAALAIVLWQYARRKTSIARILAAAAVVIALAGGALFPWTQAFALQARISPPKIVPSSIHIGLDLNRKWLARIHPATNNQMLIELPLQISGTPADTEVKPEGLTVMLHAASGESWPVRQAPPANVSFESGVISLDIAVGDEFYSKVKNQPVQLRGSFFFTLYGNRRRTSIPIPTRSLAVKDVGVCSAIGGTEAYGGILFCNSAFRIAPDLIAVHFIRESGNNLTERGPSYLRRGLTSYSPFPADLNIDPVHQFFTIMPGSFSEIILDALEPIAHLQRDFEIDGVRLSDFESPPATTLK